MLQKTQTKLICNGKLLFISFFLILNLSFSFAQQTITGKVTSTADGSAIPGANILIKNTTNGTVSDLDGIFKISANSDDILVISFIGYITEEITVGTHTNLEIALDEDVKALDEVIVIGYGSVAKKDLTGSVSSIRAEEIERNVINSFEQGIQGRMAGVHVTQSEGAPGGGISVLIRGANSFNTSTQPLYVVDGIPLGVSEVNEFDMGATNHDDASISTTNPLATIPPSEIESIEILKDASSTAIYGSRAANGVVLITTKKGTGAKGNQVSFGYSRGYSEVYNKIEVLNAREFAEFQNEADINNSILPRWRESTTTPEQIEALQGEGRYWQDEVFRVAKTDNYNLSFLSGNENANLSLLASYLDQEGVLKNSRFRRGGLRLNINSDFNNWLNVEANVGITHSFNEIVKTTSQSLYRGGVLLRAVTYTPFTIDPELGIRTDDPIFEEGKSDVNPLRYVNEVQDNELYTRLIAGITMKIKLPFHFKFETRIGGTYLNRENDIYYPESVPEGADLFGSAIVSSSEYRNFVFEQLLRYEREFNANHKINAVLGHTFEANGSEWIKNHVYDFPNDDFRTAFLEGGVASYKPVNDITEWYLESYLGRVNYIFMDKYLLTVTGRRDGSSKFAKNNKYAFFPSSAIAWRLGEESFVKNLNIFYDLKLRLSWGKSGNQSIDPYQSLGQLAFGNTQYLGDLVSTAYVKKLSADDLRWESTNQWDFGIDVSVLNNMLTITADYYIKNTVDLLGEIDLVQSTGFNKALKNFGEVQNRGIEISVFSVVPVGDFKWSSNLNFSSNKNEILNLGDNEEQFAVRVGADPDIQPYILRVGESIGAIYGYIEDGIFQNENEVLAYEDIQSTAMAGQIRYRDISGADDVPDSSITSSDQMIIGNVNPDFIIGWNNTFTYKNFDLSVLITTVQGNDIINLPLYYYNDMSGSRNIPKEVYDNRWQGEGTSNTIPQANTDRNAFKFSQRFVEDGSYIRLKQIELGYNFNSYKLKRINNARVYIKAVNLLTFTNYSGFDPEVNTYSDDASRQGLDYGNYPATRTYNVGFNLTF